MTSVNRKKCLSFVTMKTSKKRQCNNNRLHNSDFCYIHNKKKLYYDESSNHSTNHSINNSETETLKSDNNENIDILSTLSTLHTLDRNKYLDENYKYTLMCIYESWEQVEFSKQIFLDNEYWSIDILINNITFQLNNSNMENPYPIYPNNPFNRKPFHPNILMEIKKRLLVLNIPVNITLKLFLNCSHEVLNKCYDSISIHDGFSSYLLDMFHRHFRFMIINNKNSQDCYVGLWTKKDTVLSNFEILYNKYKNMPYQIIDYGYIINNPYREQLKLILNNYPITNYDPLDNKLCEKL